MSKQYKFAYVLLIYIGIYVQNIILENEYLIEMLQFA